MGAKARAPADGGIVEPPASDGTRLRLAPVPFVHANRQVDWFGDAQRFTAVYATRMQLINEILREGLEDGFDPARDVLLDAAHLHVSGAHLSGSERLVHVSETYAAESGGLPVVSYSALGHIHKTATGTRDATRSTSVHRCNWITARRERPKSSIWLELLPGRPAEVQRLPLSSGRGPSSCAAASNRSRRTRRKSRPNCCASWSRARTRSLTLPMRSPSCS